MLKAMLTEQVFCSISWIALPVKTRRSLKMCTWRRKTPRQSQKVLRSWGREETLRRSRPCKHAQYFYMNFLSLPRSPTINICIYTRGDERDAGLAKNYDIFLTLLYTQLLTRVCRRICAEILKILGTCLNNYLLDAGHVVCSFVFFVPSLLGFSKLKNVVLDFL